MGSPTVSLSYDTAAGQQVELSAQTTSGDVSSGTLEGFQVSLDSETVFPNQTFTAMNFGNNGNMSGWYVGGDAMDAVSVGGDPYWELTELQTAPNNTACYGVKLKPAKPGQILKPACDDQMSAPRALRAEAILAGNVATALATLATPSFDTVAPVAFPIPPA